MAQPQNLDAILSQLSNIKPLFEFDFLSVPFSPAGDDADSGCKLPSPQEVLAASGVQPSGDKGVWRLPELSVLVKCCGPSGLRLEEALALRAIN